MTSKITEKTSLEIKRMIKAPRDLVYAAWTNPDELKEWFGPEGVKTRAIVVDTREGGIFRWDLIDTEGDEMTIRGEFREVDPGRKIVFTWQFEGDAKWKDHVSVVTVEFNDAGEDETEVRLRHEQLPDEDSRDKHTEGWINVFDKLETFIQTR
jgi:uncharacterized protein YndB with AHSA1/START domain